MALVKLEIDGKRIIADGNQTILQVARQHGIETIPTLCDDAQLEPFASCFVCVVKVKGAKALLPACSTKVADGMVVETDAPEVRRSRKAALELLKTQDPDTYKQYMEFPATNPPADAVKKGHIIIDVGNATTLWDKVWTEVKGSK